MSTQRLDGAGGSDACDQVIEVGWKARRMKYLHLGTFLVLLGPICRFVFRVGNDLPRSVQPHSIHCRRHGADSGLDLALGSYSKRWGRIRRVISVDGSIHPRPFIRVKTVSRLISTVSVKGERGPSLAASQPILLRTHSGRKSVASVC